MRFLLVICVASVSVGAIRAQSSKSPVEPGKIIVQLRENAVSVFETRLRSLRRSSADTSALSIGLKSFDRISRKYRASNMQRVFPDGGIYEAKHRKYGLHLWYEITIPEDEDPEAAALSYGSDEYVQISEPRYTIRRMSLPALPEPSGTVPDDPFFGRQWNYNNTGQSGGIAGADIRLLEARKAMDTLGIANSSVVVAVMDGGVYCDHEDLQGNMWINDAELQGLSGVDDDHNGYVDDLHGYNFCYGSDGTVHPEDHATHVAGTIAAVTNNNIGVSGIAGPPGQNYGIKIMGTQILDGDMSVSSILNAFVYAADNGAVIAQNSWGYDNPGKYSETDMQAINYFIREAGRDETERVKMSKK